VSAISSLLLAEQSLAEPSSEHPAKWAELTEDVSHIRGIAIFEERVCILCRLHVFRAEDTWILVCGPDRIAQVFR
jgi:hypothetical protein